MKCVADGEVKGDGGGELQYKWLLSDCMIDQQVGFSDTFLLEGRGQRHPYPGETCFHLPRPLLFLPFTFLIHLLPLSLSLALLVVIIAHRGLTISKGLPSYA